MTVTNPEIPSLLYSEIEEEVRGTLRAVLKDRCTPQDVTARIDTDQPYDDALWKTVAGELGLAGLLIPESLGGADASAREVAVVLEELAKSVAPVPYFASAVLATTALLSCTASEARDGALRGLADGSRTGTLVAGATSRPGSPFPARVTATADGAALVLTGSVTAVLAAEAADLLVVPATVDGRPHLVLVDGAAPGLTRVRAQSLDATRPIGTVTFDGVRGALLAGPNDAAEALRQTLTTGAALLASEQLGVAEQALDTAVGYLKTRHQFGRPIGSFQALRHRAADLWAAVGTCRATARYAAGCVADGSPDLPVAAALAQAYCGDVAVKAAEECVQMHGGIGFTWEHPAHLYLKRAVACSLLFGTAERHRAELATLVDLPA